MAQSPETLDALFVNLVMIFKTAAFQQMGKTLNPITGKLEKNLEQARFSIDMIEMLKEKTQGNLSDDLNRFMDSTLLELRMNYVEEAKAQTAEEPSAKAGAAGEKGDEAGAAGAVEDKADAPQTAGAGTDGTPGEQPVEPGQPQERGEPEGPGEAEKSAEAKRSGGAKKARGPRSAPAGGAATKAEKPD